MAQFFGGSPKVPNIPPPPKPPTIDQAAQDADAQSLIRRRRGRAADILTGTSGDMTTPPTGAATLLGN